MLIKKYLRSHSYCYDRAFDVNTNALPFRDSIDFLFPSVICLEVSLLQMLLLVASNSSTLHVTISTQQVGNSRTQTRITRHVGTSVPTRKTFIRDYRDIRFGMVFTLMTSVGDKFVFVTH